MTILVIAEHNNAVLAAATLNTVAAAKAIGGDIHVLVAGSDCAAIGEAAAKIEGVSKVLVADNAAYGHFLGENLGELVAEVGKGYSHILTSAGTTGKDFMPRVAALLDVAQVSDIMRVESEDTFVRPIYAGNAIATVKSSDSIKVVTVRPTAFDPVAGEGGSAAVEQLDRGASRQAQDPADVVRGGLWQILRAKREWGVDEESGYAHRACYGRKKGAAVYRLSRKP